MPPIQMQFSNSINFLSAFCCISGIYIKYAILWKKGWSSKVICFWNYTLQIVGLLKYLKNHVSEYLWKLNMLKGPKDCLNMQESIFLIFLITLKVHHFVLILSDILRLFINILTADDKYSFAVKGITNAINSNAIISKSKIICIIFCCISGIEINVEILCKKKMSLTGYFFLKL